MDLNSLNIECSLCQKCALHASRTNTVFGTGNKDSSIMLIGEGPGAQEDLSGIPFVGPAGQLLDRMLEIIGLSRNKNVYITNILKCRPPGNRDPLPEEENSCAYFLDGQMGIIRPKLIICLGRIAAKKIINKDFSITREHGAFFDKDGVSVTALYHPSALLRDPSKKGDTLRDLRNIETFINDRPSLFTL